MPLFRKPRSPFWWYTITFGNKRYRASTGETTKAKATTVMANALTALARGEQSLTQVARGATLRRFSVQFLDWVRRSTALKPRTQKFYLYGWRLLSFTPLADLRLDAIRRDDVECTILRRPTVDPATKQETDVFIPCSLAYTNQALRTLKVMLGKAEEWEAIPRRPKFKIARLPGRDRLIDGATEAALQTALSAPVTGGRVRQMREQTWLFLVILQDTGMRPSEVFPMRVEHIEWALGRIFVPTGKTARARRFVGMSARMLGMLRHWCGERVEGWVFPSPRSASGHLTSIAKGFQAARAKMGIDPRVVPYSARHTYGTYAMEQTKNAFAVSKAMGHADLHSMAPYQHPEMGEINAAIDRRNRNRDRTLRAPQPQLEFPESGHTFGHTPPTVN